VDSLAFAIRNPGSLTSEEVPSCSNLRLFSSGGGTELLEWDLRRACVRARIFAIAIINCSDTHDGLQRTIGSQGGSIWSLAVNPSSTTLALGCEDGSVRLFSIAHDTLTHHRRFDRVKCRLLSIAWGPPVPRKVAEDATMKDVDHEDSSDDEDQEDDWSDSWLITGGSDSSIRKWDVNTGRVVERMGTDKIRGEKTLVWAVGVLG
jgi:U3 small nucleolar RNA-associated protein 4